MSHPGPTAPVVADLWHDDKRDRPRPPVQQPGNEQLVVLDHVVGRYGRHSGTELIRKTHLEDPWRGASESDDFTTGAAEIPNEALWTWFVRDDGFVSHRIAVEQLAGQEDVYGFDGPAMPDSLREATLCVIRLG